MSSQTMHSIQTLLRPGSLAQRITWRLDRKAALGMLLILITVSLIGWLYLTQASSLTTTSFQIEQLRDEIATLKQQNAQLELEIAEWESLPRVEQRARELGFGAPGQVLYLPVPNYPVTDRLNQQVIGSGKPWTPGLQAQQPLGQHGVQGANVSESLR